MVNFMWSAFRKVAGMNNTKKPIDDENEKMESNMTAIFDSMDKTIDAPLAKFDADDL